MDHLAIETCSKKGFENDFKSFFLSTFHKKFFFKYSQKYVL